MTDASILRRELTVKPSESNANRELPLPVLVGQMIDLATDHANELGIGYINLSPKGLGWVLSRLSVEMKRWPKTGEHFILSTWIETWNPHFSDRAFSIMSPEGEVLGYIRTIWVIIDLKSHKSVGTAAQELPENLIAGIPCPIPKSQKHRPLEKFETKDYTFKYSDLDFYRHVNTVRYISLLLNQFSLEDFDNNFISRFDIAFSHEAKYGEKVIIKSLGEECGAPSLLTEEDRLSSRKTVFELTVEDTLILTSNLILTSR